MPADAALRLYLVVRRGSIGSLARAGELAGAAAVACVRAFGGSPEHAEAFDRWTARPRKVCLRARPSEWLRLLEEPHALAGSRDGEGVLALPPRPRPGRGELLDRLQAMSSTLAAPPTGPLAPAGSGRLTYVLNPDAPMSSGKALAQIGHAAVAAAARPHLARWVETGCPAAVIAPAAGAFAALAGDGRLVARVVDAGLTELPPGTVTVLALLAETS